MQLPMLDRRSGGSMNHKNLNIERALWQGTLIKGNLARHLADRSRVTEGSSWSLRPTPSDAFATAASV